MHQNRNKSIGDLFAFLDSETPTTRKWVKGYLTKQGIALTAEIPMPVEVQSFVTNKVCSHFHNESDIEKLASKMRNAWRVRRHRMSKDARTLTISLDKSVISKLSKMSKGLTQADIITQLIEDNFNTFLAMKHEQKLKEIEAKKFAKASQDSRALRNFLSKPQLTSSETAQQLRIADDLKDVIGFLDEIVSQLKSKAD